MENNSHVKKLFSQTVIYGLGIILNKSVSFILLPLYTNYFDPGQIGLFALIQSLSFFLGVIYMFGVETSFMKFFIDSTKEIEKSVIYSSSLIFLTFTSVILSLLIYLNSDNISSLFQFSETAESIYLIQILSLLMLVDTMSRFPLLLFRAELNSKMYAYINLLTFIINIVCNIIFIVFLRTGVEAIFYSYIISVSVTFILGLILTRKYLTFKVSFEKIKELLIFGNKFIYIGIFVLVIDVSDKFFLKYFFDESMVGIYSANYRLASVMGFAIAAFRFSWTPYFLNLTSNPENKKIISTVFTYFTFIGLLLFLILSAFLSQIVKLSLFGFNFLDVNYWEGLEIVPVVLLAYFFSGLYTTLNAAPFFTNNTGSLLLITLTGLVTNIILNFLLIPAFNITGAALSTMITYLVMFIVIYVYSQKIYRIEFDWKRIYKITLLTVVFFSLSFFGVSKLNLSDGLIVMINLLLIGLFILMVNSLHLIELKKISILWKK